MATFTFFEAFYEDVNEKVHNLGSDTLKWFLTNTAPNAATHTAYDGVTGSTGPAEIANGNGYTTGGNTSSITSSAQTSGTYKLVLADPATWTATGTVGPFRYAVLYNDTSAGKELIGYIDRGSSLTLENTDTYTVDCDPTNGVIQAS